MCETSIMTCIETGILMLIAAKKQLIEREVALHLGTLPKGLSEKSLCELYVFNAEESHFVVNLYDGHTLTIKCDTNAK